MPTRKSDSRPSEYHISVVRRSAAKALSDRKIREAVRHVLGRHKVLSCDLEVAVLGAAAMARLNRQWLGHEGATDVITFDLGDAPRPTGTVVGQVNVCWPIAQRQAKRRGLPADVELLLYVVHGVLHLVGYDDHEQGAFAKMHAREDRMLMELGYGTVYAAPRAGRG